ncbi:MAG: hypothetical protein K2P81_10450 [Bacteriovoracaceae bacterium]|nr:hypothetical protein [Bacteriovoracaceae bacterium]
MSDSSHLEVLKLTTELVESYFSKLPDRGVGPSLSPLKLREIYDFKIPKQTTSADQLKKLAEDYLSNAVGTLHPQFMNQLFSGLQPWAMAGDILSTVTNTTMATYEASPLATMMERSLIDKLAEFIGWKKYDGIMVTGGSNANLVALLMGRNRLFPEIKETGRSPKPLVAFISQEAHYSFDKAFNIMGLGSKNLRLIETDESGKMKPESLQQAIEQSLKAQEAPFFIGATAGTTVMGEYDPIQEISVIAKKFGLWFHVDGAWGGSALISKKHRSLMQGIELVDSMGWDNHKMLGTGLISSFFLTQHENALRASHAGGGGEYIFHASEAGSWDLGPSSLQCGRKTDAVKTWFAWRAQGEAGMEKLVDGLFAQAQMAADLILQKPQLELISRPTSLNVCFKVQGAKPGHELEWHRSLREKLMENGQAMVNIATRKGESFIRLIIAHPEQNQVVINKLINDLIQAAK